MAKPGPKPKVSDDRLLLEILLAESNVVFAAQVQEKVDLETTQGVRDRLNELADETGYVSVEEVSGRNLYSLSGNGEQYLHAKLRTVIS